MSSASDSDLFPHKIEMSAAVGKQTTDGHSAASLTRTELSKPMGSQEVAPPGINPNEQHLCTDHLLDDLKGRSVSGGIVTVMSQGIQFTLTLGSTMVLARLLTPRDFGLVAMVWTVMGFLRVFREAGLSTATVQREGITHAQVSNLFWVNVLVSIAISLLVVAVAPAIAWFYREPRLLKITLALSVTFLLTGLSVQHLAILNRQMRFKTIALIQIGSVTVGVLVGIGMAWLKCDYWSLVGMNVATSLIALLLTWSASGWRPQLFTRHSGTRPLVHFGASLTAGSFFYSLARGLDGLLIGRVYGAFSTGLYSRASTLLARPLQQAISPIEAVFIPALSRLQSQPDRYRRTFLQIYEAVAMVGCLLTGMCFALARPLTLVVLGPKWEGAAIIFAGFTFAALQYPLTTSATWLFVSQGRGRDAFLAGSIISVIIAGSFAAGLPYGPAGVAIAYSCSCLLVQMPVMYWLAGRSGPVRRIDLWIAFLKYLPVWGIVSSAALLARLAIPDSHPFEELLVATPCGLLAGVAFIFAYSPARRAALNLLSALHGFKSRHLS